MQDWRTQAVACTFFIVAAIYFAGQLLDDGPGYLWLSVLSMGTLAVTTGHTAVTGRRAAMRKRHEAEADGRG